MKTLIAAMLMSVCVAAQTNPSQTPTPPPAQGRPMHHDMSAMHQQHMQEFKAQVEQMRAKVEAMKASLANV
ncbi:MAG TPA: hypothetical protein VH744_07330, partial [Terriglobales bacterium]